MTLPLFVQFKGFQSWNQFQQWQVRAHQPTVYPVRAHQQVKPSANAPTVYPSADCWSGENRKILLAFFIPFSDNSDSTFWFIPFKMHYPMTRMHQTDNQRQFQAWRVFFVLLHCFFPFLICEFWQIQIWTLKHWRVKLEGGLILNQINSAIFPKIPISKINYSINLILLFWLDTFFTPPRSNKIKSWYIIIVSVYCHVLAS